MTSVLRDLGLEGGGTNEEKLRRLRLAVGLGADQS
jgi:hypothetical protein